MYFVLQIVICLRGTSNYSSLGARYLEGVFVVRTSWNRQNSGAVAGEAGVQFFAAPAEFVEISEQNAS